jgi:branched-chain amino acid transport system ATP-binding protein
MALLLGISEFPDQKWAIFVRAQRGQKGPFLGRNNFRESQRMPENDVMLTAERISLSFGGIQALLDVDVEIRRGEIFALIGPNGAGKTSLMNCINGFYRAQKGSIYFEGKEITRLSSHRIAELGIGRSFQGLQLFDGLSVLDNIMAGRHFRFKTGVLSDAIYFGRTRREEIKQRKIVENIIDFFEIEAIRKSVVGALPYGMRKRVDLARALAAEPKLLLLDEPLAGMNRDEKEDIARFILDISEEMGITIAIVEHDMGVVMDICDRVVVLDFGRKIGLGTPEEIRTNEAVIRAYLGKVD